MPKRSYKKAPKVKKESKIGSMIRDEDIVQFLRENIKVSLDSKYDTDVDRMWVNLEIYFKHYVITSSDCYL